jgi:hypothetical protein
MYILKFKNKSGEVETLCQYNTDIPIRFPNLSQAELCGENFFNVLEYQWEVIRIN